MACCPEGRGVACEVDEVSATESTSCPVMSSCALMLSIAMSNSDSCGTPADSCCSSPVPAILPLSAAPRIDIASPASVPMTDPPGEDPCRTMLIGVNAVADFCSEGLRNRSAGSSGAMAVRIFVKLGAVDEKLWARFSGDPRGFCKVRSR